VPTTRNDRYPAAFLCGAACLGLAAVDVQTVVVGLTALVGPVTGGPDVPETRNTRVPFESIDNAMAAEVRLNGSHRLRFLVDTGAAATVIDVERAKALGLNLSTRTVPGQGGGEQAFAAVPLKVNELALGGEALTDATVYAIPLGILSRFAGVQIDGVLGFEFLSRYAVEIDYAGRALVLHDPAGFRYAGPGEVLPFTLEHNHVQIQADLLRPGHEPLRGKFTVDTGMAAALLLNTPFVTKHDLLTAELKARPAIPLGAGAGGDVRGVVGRVGGLRLGGVTVSEPVTLFTRVAGGYFASDERAGNVGAEVLRQFRVIVDYPRRRLILEKNAQFGEPFEWDMSGLRLLADGADLKAVKVRDVSAGSPAAAAGVRAGDEIVAVDGRPAAEFTLSRLHPLFRRAGEVRRLTLRRGGETVTVEVKLRRLF
jgi:predicted aspartyl protease